MNEQEKKDIIEAFMNFADVEEIDVAIDEEGNVQFLVLVMEGKESAFNVMQWWLEKMSK